MSAFAKSDQLYIERFTSTVKALGTRLKDCECCLSHSSLSHNTHKSGSCIKVHEDIPSSVNSNLHTILPTWSPSHALIQHLHRPLQGRQNELKLNRVLRYPPRQPQINVRKFSTGPRSTAVDPRQSLANLDNPPIRSRLRMFSPLSEVEPWIGQCHSRSLPVHAILRNLIKISHYQNRVSVQNLTMRMSNAHPHLNRPPSQSMWTKRPINLGLPLAPFHSHY